MKTVCLIGTFDTKGEEYAFIRGQIIGRGHRVYVVNTGIRGTTDRFPVDIEADKVAAAGGQNLEKLREIGDRGEAMKVMCAGAAVLTRSLYDQGNFDGILGMGGTGGTAIVTSAMRPLPMGFPKVCISTAASGDVSPYVGHKDITMIPSLVDIAGINRISRIIFARAAGAICGMVEAEVPEAIDNKPVIATTMFGNTTPCVTACMERLSSDGYEVLVFHCTGMGGRTMEGLVKEGWIHAVLDITTTEWADEVCGGLWSAGPERLDAPGQVGIPHLIVPGCVDMAIFAGMETVPERLKRAKRRFHPWSPAVTLMRTNKAENTKMGRIFAQKANAAKGPVAFLIPLRGVSILDDDGQVFCDREADNALFEAVKANLKKDIPFIELDNNINDPEFSARAVAVLLDLIAQKNELNHPQHI